MFNAHVVSLIRFQLRSIQDEIDYGYELGGVLSDEEVDEMFDERLALLDALVEETGEKDAALNWVWSEA